MESTQAFQERIDKERRAIDLLSDIAANPETAETTLDVEAYERQLVIDKDRLQRANELSDRWGIEVVLFDPEEMPGVSGFVIPSNKTKIHLSTTTLDRIIESAHVAEHEVIHTFAMLTITVTSDFEEPHFAVINKYLPHKLQEDTAMVEGFTEFIARGRPVLSKTTSKNGARAEAYDSYVGAAQQLEAMGQFLTGERLSDFFEAGDYHGFANLLKKVADRMMLLEALDSAEATQAEKLSLRVNVVTSSEPVGSTEEAELQVSKWIDMLQVKKITDALKTGNTSDLSDAVTDAKQYASTNVTPSSTRKKCLAPQAIAA